jgi:hypothetical protein
MLGHKKLENTDFYTQLLDFENDEWHVAHVPQLEEDKSIQARFGYVHYSKKPSLNTTGVLNYLN